MHASLTMVDAASTLGVTPPECDECEGGGAVTYRMGPYELTRECDSCRGVGLRLPCPHCEDGIQPGSDDTCPTCEGYGALF